MPCLTPYRGDTSQMLLFKIASCLEANSAGGGVTSFNGFTGAILGVSSFNGQTGDVVLTLADVATVADGRYVLKAGDTMTGPLNMTAGQSYQYNGVNVIRAQTTLDNYFFGPSGNLTTVTGTTNTALGFEAFISNTTGGFNTSIGHKVLTSNTTGGFNTGFGYSTLRNNISGSNNTAFGTQALRFITTGNLNVGVGSDALINNTTGSNNTAVGYGTGAGIITGSNNTILGANVTGLAAALSNNIIIADGAGNQRITVGSTGIVTIPIALSLGTAAPLSMVSGANQRAGDVTLVGGTVTTANTTVTANTRVFVSRKTIGGTPGTEFVYTLVAGVSFTITSNLGTDTSVISYLLIEVP